MNKPSPTGTGSNVVALRPRAWMRIPAHLSADHLAAAAKAMRDKVPRAQHGVWLGAGDAFDEATGHFALDYADQAERDHAALKAAVQKGKIEVYRED